MDVLIIDDERSICLTFSKLLEQADICTAFETTPAEGLARAPEASVILLDLKLPGIDGLELLDELIKRHPRTPVVMITAHGTVQVAVEAMKRGACDFIVKPPDRDELVATLKRALSTSDRETEVSALYYDLPEEFVFQDERSRQVLDQIHRVADTDLPVLLEGETGVGKDVFARLVRQWSSRADGPFIRINSAALPYNLIETELFGHEPGAHSTATTTKPGRVELADGGTLFLDEIAELPLVAQAKILQFMQDHTFERVGGFGTLTADVRLVTATNQDLEACVEKKTFRQDLFYRLCGLRVRVPSLRERKGDIEALALHFLDRFCIRYDRKLRLAPNAIRALCVHTWPGNVRELEHAMERAVAMADGEEIGPADLLPEQPEIKAKNLIEEKREFVRARVMQVLGRCGGNRTEAARILGISRRMLQKNLKSYSEE